MKNLYSSKLTPTRRRLIAYLLVVLAFAYTTGSLYSVQRKFAKEINIRQDQGCVLFERAHNQDVKALKDTYAYLLTLTPQQREKDPLNQFVIKSLPQTENRVITDAAPKYCDNPGFGLPEPNPVIPKRPAALRDVVKAR
jgi:hypothetical protein